MTIRIDRTTQRYASNIQPELDMIVLHTMEGMSWPDYAHGGQAPNSSIKPIPGVGIEVREHIDANRNGKALVNKSGGVETNRRGVFQIEFMGTCDPTHRGKAGWYYWPDADDVVLREVAAYLRPFMVRYGIPAKAPEFQAYPDSYGPRGKTNRVRLSFAEWNSYEGVVGHQHAPENVHGDPGAFPIAKLLRFLDEKAATVAARPTPTPAAVPAAPSAPAFPLPGGHWFGPESKDVENHSGWNAADRGPLAVWQQRMKDRGWTIEPTGRFDARTELAARQFQQEKGLKVDGCVGAQTWAAAWTAK